MPRSGLPHQRGRNPQAAPYQLQHRPLQGGAAENLRKLKDADGQTKLLKSQHFDG